MVQIPIIFLAENPQLVRRYLEVIEAYPQETHPDVVS